MTRRRKTPRKRSAPPRGGNPLVRLFVGVDGSSLAFLRIGFGLVMHWEVWRYLSHNWIREYYIWPTFNFPYPLFEWVTPWPGPGMFVHFALLGLLSLLIALGLCYRVSMALFFVAITYVFLLDETNYLNHLYLICILSFLFIFVPAHRRFSLDRLITGRAWPRTVPLWSLWLIGGQLGIAYFFGGVAKLNIDWLSGRSLAVGGLADSTELPLIGSLFGERWTSLFVSYSGLLLDLFIVPLLLWRRTRGIAFALITTFHLLNAYWFDIGIFPWFMILATTLFFAPNWPEAFLEYLRNRRLWPLLGAPVGAAAAWLAIGTALVPLLAGALAGTLVAWLVPAAWAPAGRSDRRSEISTPIITRAQGVIASLLAAWLLLHLAVPLRHYLTPSIVHWSEEGHRFAWHMKLRGKEAEVRFFAFDPQTEESWSINQLRFLTSRQIRKMSSRPYMIRQFARYLAAELEADGREGVEIRVESFAALNGRPRQLLIDPEADLAAVPAYALRHNPWIVPLKPLLQTSR